MRQVNTLTLVEQMKNLVRPIPEIQRDLDNAHREELERCSSILGHYKLGQDNPLLASLMPYRMAISQYTVETSLLFSSTKGTSVEVAFRLNGMPIHSFFELRYGSSVRHRDRLVVTVESIPLPHGNKTSKEDKNG